MREFAVASTIMQKVSRFEAVTLAARFVSKDDCQFVPAAHYATPTADYRPQTINRCSLESG
jgi:hypothetical protein